MTENDPILDVYSGGYMKHNQTIIALALVAGALVGAVQTVAGVFGNLYNDRTIIWRDEHRIQYDGPAVQDGRHYPKIAVEAFLAWADREVQEEEER